jgi:hypothetical protein
MNCNLRYRAGVGKRKREEMEMATTATEIKPDVKPDLQSHRREEIPAILRVSLRTVDDLILTKQLESFKIGKRRLVTAKAIAKFIRRAEKKEASGSA